VLSVDGLAVESAELAAHALATLRRLESARHGIQLVEGAHLEFLLASGSYRRFGFASFGDFVREVLHKSPRSAQRQIALRRLAVGFPLLGEALSTGRLTPCQALALQPLAGKEDLDPWILLAASCAVSDLQQAVFERTHHESGEDESGRWIRFAAPRSTALSWDHGIETARRMLGWHAPKFHCLDAILSEASSVWTEGGGNDTARVFSNGTLRDEPRVGKRGEPEGLRSDTAGELSADALKAVLACLRDADRMLDRLGTHGTPQSGPESVNVLQSLKRLDRSLRILFVRLLKELDHAGLLRILGFSTARQLLITEFKVSKRTAARLLSEGWLFEENPRLSEAFQQGTIGLGQAYLIDRVARSDETQTFIERAHRVTHLYFEREIQFLEHLREFVPGLAARFPGPLPAPGLETALREALQTLGWAKEDVAKELEDYLGWNSPAADDPQHQDPAVNPFVLRRLEGLLEILVLALEKETAGNVVPTLAAGPLAVSARAALGILPTLAAHKTVISFWAPESVLSQWNRAIAAIQSRHGPLPVWAASIILLEHALREWRKVDPTRRSSSHRLQERDEWRCQAPGCSARRRLESHHIIFRSQTGSDEPENLVTLCHGHHRHGIHDGMLRVHGIAPSALTWQLGTMRDVWTGNKRAEAPATVEG
jgi:HNH endonuclease